MIWNVKFSGSPSPTIDVTVPLQSGDCGTGLTTKRWKEDQIWTFTPFKR